MSGSRWVIIASWLSGSWRSFLYSSSVYACHLFLISSASVRSIPFPSYFMPIFAYNIPLVSQFSSRDFQSFPFYCFPLFLCIDHWGRLSYFSLAIVWNSAFKWVYISFSPLPLAYLLSLAVRPPQTTIFPFCVSFSWGWSWSLPPVQCHKPPSIVLQVLYQI